MIGSIKSSFGMMIEEVKRTSKTMMEGMKEDIVGSNKVIESKITET
jgi:hypothetical protein